mmetsp:Transcript_26730/g.67030  ORF Transcript_26730/g.67030 Transcript_26730/m.67030 type:complete len:405 (+) Transcript_26730:3-1217(+)
MPRHSPSPAFITPLLDPLSVSKPTPRLAFTGRPSFAARARPRPRPTAVVGPDNDTSGDEVNVVERPTLDDGCGVAELNDSAVAFVEGAEVAEVAEVAELPHPTKITSTSSGHVRSGSIEYVKQMRERLGSLCATGGEDPLWQAMREEAQEVADEEPLLASYLYVTIINQKSIASALAFHLANKLRSHSLPNTLLMELVSEVAASDPEFCLAMHEDLLAYLERDPACTRFIDAFLYFKGYHALQSYRVAHWLWKNRRFPLAYYMQSQISKELQVDIHPGARIGPGAFIDHATGIVIGETAVLGARCSILHHVTLGGSGRAHGDRHPKVGDDVLIGAGATLLGNIRIGNRVQIGACSLVLESVEDGTTVVGVPAKAVKRGVGVPSLSMDQQAIEEGSGKSGNGPAV